MQINTETEHFATLSEQVQKIVRAMKWQHIYGVELLTFGFKLAGFALFWGGFAQNNVLWKIVGMLA